MRLERHSIPPSSDDLSVGGVESCTEGIDRPDTSFPDSSVELASSFHRGFAFWALAPFLVLFLVAMPILVPSRGPGPLVVLCGVEAAALTLLLGLWNPYRFWWAWRALGAIVFLAYLSYAIAMLIEGRFALDRRSRPTLFNAVMGLFVFGLPGLCYALFGRLTWREETTKDYAEGLNDEFEDEDEIEDDKDQIK